MSAHPHPGQRGLGGAHGVPPGPVGVLAEHFHIGQLLEERGVGGLLVGAEVDDRGLPGGRAEDVGEPALVVATPGAEPVAEGGYAAALLLDGWVLLGRADLRAGEEARTGTEPRRA
jgi:primosomal protein N' (replication factor Y)